MKKQKLKDVTLVGVDCTDIDRLAFAAEISRKHIDFNSIKLFTSLPSNNEFVVKINPINSIEDYSYFIIKELYKYIETKYVLIIQWDGFILDPFKWKNDFLNFDYIGAPWLYDDDCNVGNGGFSLRTKRLMEWLATDDSIDKYHPEDHVICRILGSKLKMQGFKFADKKTALEFSVESEKWSHQFGFHRCDISDWNIQEFAHPENHRKYIDLFAEYFGK